VGIEKQKKIKKNQVKKIYEKKFNKKKNQWENLKKKMRENWEIGKIYIKNTKYNMQVGYLIPILYFFLI
jgi:hypothetical protein